jgi:hypothetical protein
MESSSELSSLHAPARLARGSLLGPQPRLAWGGALARRRRLSTETFNVTVSRLLRGGHRAQPATARSTIWPCTGWRRLLMRPFHSRRYMAVTILKEPLSKRRDEGDSGQRSDAVSDCGSCSLMKRPRSSAASISISEVRPARCKCCLPGQRLRPTFRQSAAVFPLAAETRRPIDRRCAKSRWLQIRSNALQRKPSPTSFERLGGGLYRPDPCLVGARIDRDQLRYVRPHRRPRSAE